MFKRSIAGLALCATAVLALSACSSGEKGQSGADSADDYVPSPLEEYLSVLWEGPEFNEDDWKEQEKKREELIAQCMADEGFEYTPNSSDNGMVVMSSDDQEGPAWGSREFAEQYGYGTIDWPGMEDTEQEPGVDYVDPNSDYVESLSQSEQEAYWVALHGEQQFTEAEGDSDLDFEEDPDIEGEEYEYRWEDNGCWGWADNEVTMNSPENATADMWEDPEFEDLFAEMESLWTATEEDPAYRQIAADWASCMAESGFPGMTSKYAAQESLWEDQENLYNPTGSEDGWQEPDPSALEEFKAKEKKLAIADWDCADKTNYVERQRDIQFKKEEAFVQKWRDQLDALVAKYSSDNSNQNS